MIKKLINQIPFKKKKLNIILYFSLIILIIYFIAFFYRRNFILNTFEVKELSKQEQSDFNKIKLEYRLKNIDKNGFLNTQNLPYKTIPAKLDINARSAILINVNTGDILYEKNTDKIIPPASMTKVFLMYTVFNKIKNGKASLDDIVPIGPESYACNMPPRSSLMFLGKGQIVTLRELMTGLAVCSGNDASHAIAYYLFGSVEEFLKEVNFHIKKLGLKNTVIVEPSGYSEKNVTTAREMADFARSYLNEFPESLELFHSIRKIAYPQIRNIPESDKNKPVQNFSKGIPESIWSTIVQENTNQLLKTLDGCDGLKTGYIDESGYNLALTCKRNGIRYLSVTMNGPGKNIFEGDKMRQQDGKILQEFAFNVFTEFSEFDQKQFVVKVLGAKENSFNLIIPCELKTAIPKSIFKNGLFDKEQISLKIEKPNVVFGKVEQGQCFGTVKLFVNNILIREEKLLSDRKINQSNVIKRCFDYLIYKSVK